MAGAAPTLQTSRASISDVARLAGVSIGTVSNVLNHPSRVRPATLDKVQRAVEQLNYRPDANARSLAEGASRTVGVLLPDLGNSLFVAAAHGAEEAAVHTGLVQMIANTEAELVRETRYLDTFIAGRAAGILLGLNDDNHYAALYAKFSGVIPTVLVNLAVSEAAACSVVSDNELGGWLAVSHLADIGRRRLAFIGGPEGLRPVRDREAGFRRAIEERGLTPVRIIKPEGVRRVDGYRAGQQLVADVQNRRIDGIFAATDLQAAGAIQALRVAGITVPDQVAVVGYDNNSAAWDSPIPLTTIAQPGVAIGKEAMRLLIQEIEHPDSHQHTASALEPTLILRASTGS